MKRGFTFLAAVVMACVGAQAIASAAVSLERGVPFMRQPRTTGAPMSTSGITFVGGDTYYAIADDRGDKPDHEGGLYTYVIELSEDGRTIRSATSTLTNEVVRLRGGCDQEGLAFDPLTGNVWVADEARNAVRAHDPKTGAMKDALVLPAVLTDSVVRNFGLEALALASDGKTLWLANEEALACDGARASSTHGTVCRLFRYTRASANRPFVAAGQFPYVTEKRRHPKDVGKLARHGISGLCALPDGSLLVLERDLSFTSAVNGELGFAVYRVADPTGVKDVTEVASLKDDTSWHPVAKELLARDEGFIGTFGNFEGICLGPRLADGAWSVLLISDAGDGISAPLLYPLVLKDVLGASRAQGAERNEVLGASRAQCVERQEVLGASRAQRVERFNKGEN